MPEAGDQARRIGSTRCVPKAIPPLMRMLAIDTALENCSVGVVCPGSAPVLMTETIGRGHAERLFGMIEAAMADAGLAFSDLDRIAVTIGPGSFTGLRVGIAAARGLAMVSGCPVVGVGTLAAIAERAREIAGPVPVLAVLDAKRGEVYAQLFGENGEPATAPAADSPASFAALATPATMLAGSGAALVAHDAAADAVGRIVHCASAPDIGALVRLGLAAPAPSGPPRPLYLRPPDAKPQTAAAVPRQ
jgi:tRNA threonylcarbamoyladenosine biosynthesis protein TsaB